VKIVIFNREYSENLGGGLGAEAFGGRIRDEQPDTTVVSCHLAGRTTLARGDAITNTPDTGIDEHRLGAVITAARKELREMPDTCIRVPS